MDHYEFDFSNPSSRGLHIQSTYLPLPNGPVPAPTPALGSGATYARSVTSGSPSITTVYPFWRRDNLTVDYPLLPIKSFCTFIARNTNGNATLVNSFNITSVARIGTGQYVVTISQPLPYQIGVTEYTVLFGNGGPSNPAYVVDFESAAPPGVTISGSQFTLQIRSTLGGNPTDATGLRIGFAILQ